MKNLKIQLRKNWQQRVFLFGMIGSIQFLVLSGVAIIFYPGNYLFFNEPLSYLGFTHIEGESNLIAGFLFNSSMFLLGISIIALFPSMIPFFNSTVPEKWFSLAGSIFAIFSGIAMVGAALTPGDINYEAHILIAPYTFLFGILMVAFFTVPMILNKDYPRQYTLVAISYVFIMMICLSLLSLGPAYDTPEGQTFQVTTQKLAIYWEVLTLFVLSLGGLRYTAPSHSDII